MTLEDITDGLLVIFGTTLLIAGVALIHTRAADASPTHLEFCLASDHTNTFEDCQ